MEDYNEQEKEVEEQTPQLQDVHQRALKRFDDIQSTAQDEREQALEDRRFSTIAGAQWEGSYGEQFANRPKLEVNKIHLSLIRIESEYRNNRITVNYLAKNGNDDLADTCDMLYRADERDSSGEEAYDNAFNEGVNGGIGAWRYIADYEDQEDDENDYQRIKVKPIYDADTSVYFWGGKEYDKSDAKGCFVITGMSPDEYETEWNDDPESWSKAVDFSEFDWNTPDTVYVAEYYECEYIKDEVKIYKNSMSDEEERYNKKDFEANPMLESDLLAKGFQLIKTKKVKKKKIHKYILSGGKVLEDCGYIAGKNIPIVPFYGKRWYIDNIERSMGHVRLAKDAQRLKNMQLSKLAEISASSTIEKPIVSPEQIKGHEKFWQEDNFQNYAFLTLNSLKDAQGNVLSNQPLAYTKPINIPPALAALLQITDQDMKELLGNREAMEKVVSNISGEAIQKITDQLDMQTYIYMSNFAKSMKRAGEIWLSMAKEIYVEDGRVLKGVNEQGTNQLIELNKPVMNEDQETYYENDLTKANFDIIVDVGASSTSKRAATVDKLTTMLQMTTDPETAQVLNAMILINMDGEGLDDARDFFRKKLVNMGVVKPNEEEQEQMELQAAMAQPSVQDQYLAAEAEKANAQAQKAQADTFKAVAETKKTEAQTVDILAGVDRKDREQLINTVEKINQSVSQPQNQVLT